MYNIKSLWFTAEAQRTQNKDKLCVLCALSEAAGNYYHDLTNMVKDCKLSNMPKVAPITIIGKKIWNWIHHCITKDERLALSN